MSSVVLLPSKYCQYHTKHMCSWMCTVFKVQDCTRVSPLYALFKLSNHIFALQYSDVKLIFKCGIMFTATTECRAGADKGVGTAAATHVLSPYEALNGVQLTN